MATRDSLSRGFTGYGKSRLQVIPSGARDLLLVFGAQDKKGKVFL